MRHQHQFSINVWAGIAGDHLGPHVLPARLTGNDYLQFLREELPVMPGGCTINCMAENVVPT
jgi:hypothetical protein